jgi:hypothetical protein
LYCVRVSRLHVIKDTEIAYLALFVLRGHALALQNSVLAVEKKVTETFDAVALPVFYKSLELFDRLDSFFPGNRVVGTCEDGGGGFDAP